MGNRRGLSKQDKRELISAIDGLLDLLFVPIAKAADDEIAAVELTMSDLLIAGWDQQSKAAIEKAANAISAGDGPPKKAEVSALLQILSNELGPGFQTLTAKEQSDLVGAAYLIGKKGALQEAAGSTSSRVTASLSLQDEQAQHILKNHHMFWVGDYYDDTLGNLVADTVNDIALNKGLGRKAVGNALRNQLSGLFEQERPDTYWRLLGAAAVHRARNLGGVSGLEEAGVDEYEIMSVLDERTSTICRAMDGRVFKVGHAVQQRDAILAAKKPQDIKKIAPWHTARETPSGGFEIRANGSKEWTSLDKLTPAKAAARGLALPPYHAFCRTTYIVRSFLDDYTGSNDPLPIAFSKPEPASAPLPAADALTYSKNGKGLGGAGQKDIYTDEAGNRYLFKPATSKGGSPELFRAYAQEAASEIQKIAYDGDDFIEVKTVELGGQTGTLQKLLATGGDLKGQTIPAYSQAVIDKLQAEQVIDWLISNHDSHGGNFIYDTNGKVFAIDKEQAFRYFPDDKLAWTYHPNDQYGEAEPVYNTMLKHWIAGDLDLNPNHILPYIQRIEAITDEDYEDILMNYATSRFESMGDVDAFLQAAVARKNNIRKDFERLYSRALTQKIGQKYTFTFADKMPAKDMAVAPLAVQSFSKADLSKMTSKTLKELGKAHGVAYFQQMKKAELVEALAFPEKAEGISALVKERTRARAALARAEGAQEEEETQRPARGTDPFDDLSAIGAREYGHALQKDSTLIEGQHINIRKTFTGTGDEYEISFKLLADRLDDMDQSMKDAGAKVEGSLYKRAGAYDKSGTYIQTKEDEVRIHSRNLTADIGGARVTYYNDREARAYRGRVDIRVAGDGQQAAAKLRKALDKLGLSAVRADAEEADERLLKLSRLLAQHKPKQAGELAPADRTIENMESLLRAEGIDPDAVDKWTKKEVWPGYFAYMDEAGAKDMQEAGADHLFANVRSADRLIQMMQTGGMMSTTERYRNGAFLEGASSAEDIRTGGAEQVFTRLVTKNVLDNGVLYSGSGFGNFTIKIKPDILARTDWYAFSGDRYGESEDYRSRLGRETIVNRFMSRWEDGNEVMFRHGITTEYFDSIVVKGDEAAAEAVRQQLRDAGIKEVNGVPLSEFVKSGGEIK